MDFGLFSLEINLLKAHMKLAIAQKQREVAQKH